MSQCDPKVVRLAPNGPVFDLPVIVALERSWNLAPRNDAFDQLVVI